MKRRIILTEQQFNQLLENNNININENLDKSFGMMLKDYLTADDKTKLRKRLYYHGLFHFPEFCEKLGIEISDEDADRCSECDETMFNEIVNGKYGKYTPCRFCNWLERTERSGIPTVSVMKYSKELKNEWLIHFSNNAYDIWKNGFTKATYDVDEVGYSGGQDMEGYDFAYVVDRGIDQCFTYRQEMPNYGDEAILFQANAVEAYHRNDKEYQAVFYNNDAKNLIYIRKDTDYDVWYVVSNRNGRALYYNEDLEEVIWWAINNFDQYKSAMLNPHESRNRKTNLMKGEYGAYGTKVCEQEN